jgi:hypothetical protein
MGVKAGDRVCGRNTGRRRRVGTGLYKVNLRKSVRAIKMGHGDSFALDDHAGGEKNLARDRESVIARKCGIGAAVVVLCVESCTSKKYQAQYNRKRERVPLHIVLL